jgi:cation transport ATPase
MSADDIALAEKLTRRRARAAVILGILFLLSHAGSYGSDPGSRPETIRLAGWIVWAFALLIVLATGGSLFRTSSVRALVNDESTTNHLRSAQSFGFWTMAVTAIVLYAVTYFEPLAAREAIRLILTFSIGLAMLRFGRLELKSLNSD